MLDPVRHELQERVKELTALHGAARVLQETSRAPDEIMADLLLLLPPAWQYPASTVARITLGETGWTTAGFPVAAIEAGLACQREVFRLRDGTAGAVEVLYREPHPPADEGPFLREERDLIRSLAEMLRAYWQHRHDDAAILAANERLEAQVAERTAALRRLASELCLLEARERRAIAEDLHDHLGQGLAFARARLRQLQGDVVFGGHDGALSELVDLLDQAIAYTRSLTFELSPPILYELGLGPALEWLGETFARKHGLKVAVRDGSGRDLPDDVRVLFFRSASELLHNVVKHAAARRVRLELTCTEAGLELVVQDDGRGFLPAAATADPADRPLVRAVQHRGETAPARRTGGDPFRARGGHPGPAGGAPGGGGDPVSVRIVLADDHRMFRDGLRALLGARTDLELVGEAEDGVAALDLTVRLRPDILIVDLAMPRLHGLEVVRRVARESQATRIIVLSMHSDRRYVVEALRAGAVAYVLKESGFAELAEVIQDVLAGRLYLSPAVAEQVIRDYVRLADVDEGGAFSVLSVREREVMQHIVDGQSTKEIAGELHVSVKTVESHRKQIMDKLGLHSVVELTKFAIREGLTRLE